MNHSSISGRLGRDPELRTTSSGVTGCSFSLAVKRPYAREGEADTDWINVQAWKQSAEFLCNYAAKGDMIGVEGRIQTRKYSGRDGVEKTVTEVIAERLEILSSASREAASATSSRPKATSSRGSGSAAKARQSLPTASAADIAGWASEEEGVEINPDDLPF